MERTLDTYFGPGAYTIAPEISFVNLKLGFGPPLLTQVRRVIPDHPSQLIHSHIVYDWPFRSGHAMLGSSPHQDDHSVLPAILADTSDLRNELDKHLSKLINDELSFRQFPLYNSPLRILKHVYMLYRDLSDTGHRHLLHTALKLLVLVHIGDQTELDTSVPLFYTFSNNNSVYNMKPCFIRGQLGAVIPSLAQDLLREALSKLEFICLARRCTDWPPVLAALATLCMAVESVQYHAAKKPYHAHFGASSSFDNSSSTAALNDSMFLNPNVLVFGPERLPPDTTNGVHSSSSSINEDEADSDTASLVSLTHEESANRLIAFYRTCYRGCHCSRLQDFDPASSSSRRARRQQAEQDAVSARFIDGLKGSLRNAREYLVQRRHAGGSVLKMMGAKMGRGLRDYGRNGDVGSQEHGSPVDMSIFFDRLLAKLFLD